MLIALSLVRLLFKFSLYSVYWIKLATRRKMSVRPSVTHQYGVETSKDILKLFSQWASHTILVFPSQTLWKYSDGDLPDGCGECTGGIYRDYRTRSLSRK